MDTVHKIGRRKTAVARIYLSEGKGNITVNKKDFAFSMVIFAQLFQSRIKLSCTKSSDFATSPHL